MSQATGARRSALRILFLTPGFPPMLGGGERYAHALAHQLAQRGHEVTVLTSDARGERDLWQRRAPSAITETREGPLRVIRCPAIGLPGGQRALLAWRAAMILLSALPGDQTAILSRLARGIPAIAGLEEALAGLGPFDLIHGFNLSWEHPLVVGWRYARQRGLPLIVTPFAHFGVGAQDRIVRNNTMDHQLAMLREADGVLALTGIEREGLVRYGVAPERAVAVGGGLDLPIPQVDAAQVVATLKRHGLSGPLILFVGRVSRDKGALDAAEAVRRLRAQGVEATLALVGHVAPEFESYLASLPPEARPFIRSLGAVDEVEKHALLCAARMLILPSRVDSFGIVFLEAWAHGKPVIGARAGGIPGLVRDGEDGLLVPYDAPDELAAAMQRLLQDDALANALGRRGQERLPREYTWEHVADRVLEMYERIIA